VSSTSAILTSPPAPLLPGEGSKNPPYSLLLPRLLGEGGREGEVCRTHVKRYANRELARKNLGDRTLPIADLQITTFIFINHGERGSRTVNVLPSPG
jgi:hypothetical protein